MRSSVCKRRFHKTDLERAVVLHTLDRVNGFLADVKFDNIEQRLKHGLDLAALDGGAELFERIGQEGDLLTVDLDVIRRAALAGCKVDLGARAVQETDAAVARKDLMIGRDGNAALADDLVRQQMAARVLDVRRKRRSRPVA